MMHFAICRRGKNRDGNQHMLVGFEYLAERNTFVKYSEFEKADKHELNKLSGESERLCRQCEKMVYNQDGMKVAYIDSLYKPASQQRIKRPESTYKPTQQDIKSKSVIQITSARTRNRYHNMTKA